MRFLRLLKSAGRVLSRLVRTAVHALRTWTEWLASPSGQAATQYTATAWLLFDHYLVNLLEEVVVLITTYRKEDPWPRTS